MKVRSVDNTFNHIQKAPVAASKGIGRNSQVSSAPSFRGVDPTTCLIDFWAAMARGGLAASFTVQDMLGTNFPRTAAALNRNKDITGENNYKAAVEVAIREFTTGPSMFIIPALVLAGASRLSGEANKVDSSNIASFSEIMRGTVHNLDNTTFATADFKQMSQQEAQQACQTIKKAFYKDAFTNIFKQYDISSDAVNIDEYVNLMMKAESPNTPKRNFFMSMFNKKVKVLGREVDSKDEVISQIASKFVADKKANTEGWGNFTKARVVSGGKEFNITDITSDLKNFSDDFAKRFVTAKRSAAAADKKVLANKFIDNFRDMRVGSRALTNVMMVVATGLFMCVIPKLYTRHKTNPETDAIYAQVNQQRKGAVNGNNGQ